MVPQNQNELARRAMVAEQLERRGIRDSRVLIAMGTVRREMFVPPEERSAAYADRALVLEHGQTISQPYIVALMTEALELSGRESVFGNRHWQRVSNGDFVRAGAIGR